MKVCPTPTALQSIVGGDPDRNQSKAIVQSGGIGYPVTRKIELPEDWNERIKKTK